MADVTLRFQGRFLYVHQGIANLTSVVAPRYPHSSPHQPLMSIRHAYVQFAANGARKTTLEPVFRILSDEKKADAQIVVWNLTGLRVKYKPSREGDDPKIQGHDCEVAGIHTLEANEDRTAKLHPAALKPGSALSSAVIEVFGSGEAETNDDVPTFFFSKESDANQHAPKKVRVKGTQQQDYLTIVPADRVKFGVNTTEATLTLQFFDRDNILVGVVCVKDGGTVCFSNWCPTISDTPLVDLEFSRYYDLIVDHDPGALLPFVEKLPRREGTGDKLLIEGIPCYQQSQISEP